MARRRSTTAGSTEDAMGEDGHVDEGASESDIEGYTVQPPSATRTNGKSKVMPW